MKLGNSRCQCLGCDEYFNSVAAFDKHRVTDICGNKRCLTSKELPNELPARNKAGFWVASLSSRFEEKTA